MVSIKHICFEKDNAGHSLPLHITNVQVREQGFGTLIEVGGLLPYPVDEFRWHLLV